MSLATRCTSCHTVFRVVQDQLKVSEGWVRCGRCGTVFNALEALFDLDRETVPLPLAATPSVGPSPDTTGQRDVDTALFAPRRTDGSRAAAAGVSSRDRNEFADAQFNTDLLAGEHLADPEFQAHTQPELRGPSAEDPLPEQPDIDVVPSMLASSAPDFIRHADRRAKWQSPQARWLLSLTTMVLLMLLGLQVTHHFRDHIAARWPPSTAMLNQLCTMMDCKIEAPRRIGDVVVDSTSLSRSATNADVFQLLVTLRNRGSLDVAMPSVDLSLSDTSGQLIARRVLSPLDFQGGSALLTSGTESPLQVLLSTGDQRVVGYTVEIFYP
jgi:predicted Zn finger-like uncharacterized protein